MNIGILASSRGSNFRAILDAIALAELDATVTVAISNNSGCGAMELAVERGIPTAHLSTRTHGDPAALDAAITDTLEEADVDLVVLAGYMKKLGPRTLATFADRIINIHPALLPNHGGPGMYGMKVHEAVLASGDRETGATVHLVNAEYDSGRIISQARVPVHDDDTPTRLAARVLATEHALLIQTLKELSTQPWPKKDPREIERHAHPSH